MLALQSWSRARIGRSGLLAAVRVEQPLRGATHGQRRMAGILIAAFLCETPTPSLPQLLRREAARRDAALLCQAFLPSPRPLPGCVQNKHKTIRCLFPRKRCKEEAGFERRGLRRSGGDKVFPPVLRSSVPAAFFPSVPSFEPAVTLQFVVALGVASAQDGWAEESPG